MKKLCSFLPIAIAYKVALSGCAILDNPKNMVPTKSPMLDRAPAISFTTNKELTPNVDSRKNKKRLKEAPPSPFDFSFMGRTWKEVRKFNEVRLDLYNKEEVLSIIPYERSVFPTTYCEEYNDYTVSLNHKIELSNGNTLIFKRFVQPGLMSNKSAIVLESIYNEKEVVTKIFPQMGGVHDVNEVLRQAFVSQANGGAPEVYTCARFSWEEQVVMLVVMKKIEEDDSLSTAATDTSTLHQIIFNQLGVLHTMHQRGVFHDDIKPKNMKGAFFLDFASTPLGTPFYSNNSYDNEIGISGRKTNAQNNIMALGRSLLQIVYGELILKNMYFKEFSNKYPFGLDRLYMEKYQQDEETLLNDLELMLRKEKVYTPYTSYLFQMSRGKFLTTACALEAFTEIK